jgi:hypothetical protein
VAAYPDQVRLLVAHEAPLADLLDEPDRSQLKERQRDVDATFQREGLFPAMQKILAFAGGFGDDPEPEIHVQRPSGDRVAQHGANLQFFLTHDSPSAHRYQLDCDGLRWVSRKVVPAAGVISRGSLPYRCAQSLARLLGHRLHELPGGHSGYVNRPQAFGEELHRVLAAGT